MSEPMTTIRRLTMEERTELRALDLRVAQEIFGERPGHYDCPHFDKKTGRMLSFCGCPSLPEYTLDMNQARQMEAEIGRRGLQSAYVRALILETWRDDIELPKDNTRRLWRLICAAPGQRCRAALAAVEGAKIK